MAPNQEAPIFLVESLHQLPREDIGASVYKSYFIKEISFKSLY